jgi:cold shock CspA family protein
MFRSTAPAFATVRGLFSVSSLLLALTRGTVTSWNLSRGFGFLEGSDTRETFFCHHTAVQVETGGIRSLKAGDVVEFELAEADVQGRRKCERVTAVGGGLLPSGPKPTPAPSVGGRGAAGFTGRGGRGRGGRGGGFQQQQQQQSFGAGSPGHGDF